MLVSINVIHHNINNTLLSSWAVVAVTPSVIVVFGPRHWSIVVRMSEVPLGADGLAAGWFNRDAQIQYVQKLSIHQKNNRRRERLLIEYHMDVIQWVARSVFPCPPGYCASH